MSKPPDSPILRIGPVLRKWRILEQRSLRDVAKEMDLDAATLSRIEQGRFMQGRALAKVLKWLLETLPCPQPLPLPGMSPEEIASLPEEEPPSWECSHDRLNEDGICRGCGRDCRGIG